jgi:hypothetical protein
LGWRAFQIAIVVGIGYWAHNDPDVKASPGAIGLFGILVALLATGVLAALFRLIRRALGRSTEDDRIWRATEAPRSPLAAAHEIAEARRRLNRAARRERSRAFADGRQSQSR